MENLEKIQEIGTTEKAWIEYAKSIDRNNERLYLYTKENVSDAMVIWKVRKYILIRKMQRILDGMVHILWSRWMMVIMV